jgi:hypothetical protein
VKRIIFLDIDGVLATPKQYATRRNKLYKKDSTAAGLGIPYLFDEKCVIAFNRFILMNDVEIVLSSDWRRHFDMGEIDTIFKINGVAKSPFSFTKIFEKEKLTEDLESIRVREIKDWLDNNEYELWCAVDDMDLSALGHQFVQTDERMGFGDRDFFHKVEAAMYPF